MIYLFVSVLILLSHLAQANDYQFETGGLIEFQHLRYYGCSNFHAPLVVEKVLERHSADSILTIKGVKFKKGNHAQKEDFHKLPRKIAQVKYGLSGMKLFEAPNENSNVVGYFLDSGVQDLNGLAVGKEKDCWEIDSEEVSLNEKNWAYEFINKRGEHVAWLEDYIKYPARFWELRQSQPEKYDVKWYQANLCNLTKEWNVCKEATDEKDSPIEPSYFYVRDSRVKGPNRISQKYFDVWRQLPFKIEGIYPWIISHYNYLPTISPKTKPGDSFNDMIGKKFYFTVMPEYFESADGSVIYLRKHSREMEFKSKKIIRLINGFDYDFNNTFITHTTSHHMYFKFYSSSHDKEYIGRVSVKELFRKNGSIRLKNSNTRFDYSDYVLPLKMSGAPK